MLLSEILAALESIAATRLAEPWDNVGLLAGDPAQSVSRALLCIDYTEPVAAEAAAEGCDLVIAYHPPLFSAVKRITAASESSLLFDAVRRGVAIYSPHTALDVADGGTNDTLADVLGITPESRTPLRVADAKASQYKLVTFVPEDALERVAQALFEAGAGRIGDYTQCSFRHPGTGTFKGDPSTNPAVGRPGRYEHAVEFRLETVLPISRLQPALAALYDAHPYEEPAFDLVRLAAAPEKTGQGRIGNLPSPTQREELFDRVKQGLNLSHLLIAGPQRGAVMRCAVLAGAGREHLSDAISQKAELYLTGEIPHHDAVRAAGAGVTVVATLHSNSERATLKRLADRLAEKLPSLSTHLSRADHDPFTIQ